MTRRDFIILLGAAAAWPVAARAQQALMPTIGFLGSESAAMFATHLRMFRQGLSETGYVEGQNVAIEYRWAEGQNERLPALAADLVRRQVAVIATPGTTPAALAAKAATTTIPIVFFTAGDPVALKLVGSLSRPGGNLTGATSLGGELAPKRLELLHQLMPTATVMAVLVNPSNPALAESTASKVQEAARALGLRLHTLRAATERDFDSVFTELVRLRASGLVIGIDSFFTARREQLGALALRHGIAAIYQDRDFAVAGGVMTYGVSLTEGYRLVGLYTGRILKGERPADLPVQQLTRIELIINMKTAKALGLSVPPILLVLANEVIE
ncbi:MAG: ABC transporter substrate-binding protein [Betaproteobacteria bacterium]|nr:ABC transporter substrate-binding protein [Betaproteobacteria bacterium]